MKESKNFIKHIIKKYEITTICNIGRYDDGKIIADDLGIDYYKHLDLNCKIPNKYDLVLCRDIMIHMNYNKSIILLNKICESNSKYILTNVYPDHINEVKNSLFTINLEKAPFKLLNKYMEFQNEGCTGEYSDKSLVLLKISKIKRILKNRLSKI